MHEIFNQYISEINKCYSTGVAREHAYRPALQNLMIGLLPNNYTVVNEPARSECGAPDFIILKGESPIAFIEAKDLQDTDLDGKKEHKEQFERYRASLDHIIFTDYLDFHLYENGEFVDAVRLADVRGEKIVLNKESVNKFLELINRLANATPQRITSPMRLAKVMASKARLLANVIEKALENDKDKTSELANQMKVFQKLLIHDMNEKTFADIYAQTIAYGLFTARLNDKTPEDFSRMEANMLIPKSNPFLRKIFNDIAGFNVDSRIAWIVDDLVEAFLVTDMSKVMKDFGKSTKRNDPIMHFYEDFLNQYDPQTKAKRGVYYTPQPVVDFIVRAVDDILKHDFNLPMGLADNSMIEHEVVNDQYTGKKGDAKTLKKQMHRVQILDPATGTGTFLATAIRQIHANMEGQWGAWNSYVEQHLLPRLNGFELMMASYTIAHLKLGMVLQETGFTQQSDKRFRVYLTNSLEEHNADTGTLFSAAISNESNEASYIKRDTPVMVMIGNPPYSGESSNKGEWINQLMTAYKKEPGGTFPLQERNSKWINDDYCKFIRLAQNYIDKNKIGVVAFINNNGFLDNPTFRGMRWSLMQSFDKLYILNLHGNSMKHETCFDGSPDENVFDIMVGTSINIFVKTGKKATNSLSEVYYCDLMGERQMKYDWLIQHNLETSDYKNITPCAPHYLFVPQNNDLLDEYRQGFIVSELLKVNSMGVTTGDDKNLIGYTHDDLIELGNERLIRKITYRPFDSRYIYYDTKKLARARWPFMGLFDRNNIGICLIRINSKDDDLCVYAINCITDKTILSSKDNANVFPLYLYSDEGKVCVPNLNKEIWNKINTIIGEETIPENIFDYIYAVLHSPDYRAKYKQFLKIDFPRIPYPKNKEEYHRLANIGSQLRHLHLMENVPSSKYAQFNISGSNVVEKPEYKANNVWINKEQCFSDVPETAWNFYIGGYQPAQKWLKDRKGRELTFDDIAHYRKIISILLETDRLMKEIDGK
ncbi:MAG: N-6 DNA methylase [Bacteroidales bacterium]|nr:N-6 DNA methylase [Bacteroidales bacterium]